MREIKFKVFLGKKLLGYERLNSNGNWESASIELDSKDGKIIRWHKMVFSFGGRNLNKVFRKQFTGLRDKNGCEIYEGDIISSKNCFTYSQTGNKKIHLPFEVVFKYNGFYYVNFIDGPDEEPFFDEINISHKVIGNVIENPELLK